MRILWLDTQDPFFNLAAEEYLLKETEEDIFMLWQNADSVIIGRYQNTMAEVNMEFIESHHVTVARRITGGGAVFHDLGNLNFTFIQKVKPHEKEVDFQRYLTPIVDALRSLNVPAEFSGRNDLTIEGRKISGNAMVFYQDRVLEHGTLLFSTIPDHLAAALKVDPAKFSDKAVKSVRSRVTNISEHLSAPMTVTAFKDYLLRYMTEQWQVPVSSLTTEETSRIRQMADAKNATWEWNFGKSPQYAYQQKLRTKGGSLEVLMNVQNGIIQDIRFYGDFFSSRDPEELSRILTGQSHNRKTILGILQDLDISTFFNNVTKEEFISLLSI
ncbi:MAG: lipoate--protein ligase [Bacteroidales bacterium]|nr:lipoate--protein ligase [Bacteroidales bacterium]